MRAAAAESIAGELQLLGVAHLDAVLVRSVMHLLSDQPRRNRGRARLHADRVEATVATTSVHSVAASGPKAPHPIKRFVRQAQPATAGVCKNVGRKERARVRDCVLWWIDPDGARGRRRHRGAAYEAFRVRDVGSVQGAGAAFEALRDEAVMHIVRREQAEGIMVVLGVYQVKKSRRNARACSRDAKRSGKSGRYLERLERRLGKRVVV
jgi:hypothetical protein